MATPVCFKCGKSKNESDFYCRHCGSRLRSWFASRRALIILLVVCFSVLISGAVSGWAVHQAKRSWRQELAGAQQARVQLEADLKQLRSDAEATREGQRNQDTAAEAIKKQMADLGFQLNSFGADTKNLEANTAKIRQLETELTAARMELAKANRELVHLRGEVAHVKGEQITTNNGLFEMKADLKSVRGDISKPASSSREAETAIADALSRLERAEKKLKELADVQNRKGAEKVAIDAVEPSANAGKHVSQNWMSLTDALSRNERVTQARVREVLGPPDSVHDTGASVLWQYELGSYSTGRIWLEKGYLKTVYPPSFK